MIEPKMTPSVRATLDELLDLFLTDQPTGLIADEMIRSHHLSQMAVRGGVLENVLRTAEAAYGTKDFWYSPPPLLELLIERTRAELARRGTRDLKRLALLEMATGKEPVFLHGMAPS